MSFAGAAALLVAGCGQEGPVNAAPAPEQRGVTAAASPTAKALAQSDFCIDAEDQNNCTPTGAHGSLAQNFVNGHAGFECKECHYIGGRLAFKPASEEGLAFLPEANKAAPNYDPNKRPSYDAETKTCSNIACHYVKPGVFSYYFPGNEMDEEGYPIPELKTVHYGGGTPQPTPPWNIRTVNPMFDTCSSCHGNPPANGSDGANTWHSGSHANNQNVGPVGPNECALCHNQLVPPSTYNSVADDNCSPGSTGPCRGTAILIPGLHADGQLSVVGRFRSQCFGCH